MKCPYCGHLGDKVVDSRESREGEVIRRRRECLECGRRFTSYERVDEIPYMVVKKDGRRERFERQKLIAGLLRACEKRPVSVAALELIADRVEMTLQDRPERNGHGGHRGLRHAGAEAARQGGVRAIRVRLPSLPRRRRIHDGAARFARDQGTIILVRSLNATSMRTLTLSGTVLGLLLLIAGAANIGAAADQSIQVVPLTRDGFVFVSFAVSGVVDEEMEQTIQSGLPTTFEVRRGTAPPVPAVVRSQPRFGRGGGHGALRQPDPPLSNLAAAGRPRVRDASDR